jgi:hypothetical protein
MNEEQIAIIKKILDRMRRRRNREEGGLRNLTLSYAVSTKTGACYVGYNNRRFEFGDEKDQRWNTATGQFSVLVYGLGNNICAEASALSIALAWGEKIEDLVFLAMNHNQQPYNPCELCRTWMAKPKGALICQHPNWTISNAGSFSREDWAMLNKAADGYDVNDVLDYHGVATFS